MIPLSRADMRPHFYYRLGKWVSACIVLAWLVFEVRFWLGTFPRSGDLLVIYYGKDRSLFKILGSFWVFPNTFAMIVNSLFVWVFFPILFMKRRNFLLPFISVVAVWLSASAFFLFHPYLIIPIPLVDAFIAFFLGAVMRLDIWGNINTLVFGPGILRVFQVPSYVLFFFWFFYLMIANFFMPEPFTNLPMLYWLPFSAFIQGFVVQSILLIKVPKVDRRK